MASKKISSEDGFVSLNVRASVLQKMLNGEVLHMTIFTVPVREASRF